MLDRALTLLGIPSEDADQRTCAAGAVRWIARECDLSARTPRHAVFGDVGRPDPAKGVRLAALRKDVADMHWHAEKLARLLDKNGESLRVVLPLYVDQVHICGANGKLVAERSYWMRMTCPPRSMAVRC